MTNIFDPKFSSSHNYKTEENLQRRRKFFAQAENEIDIYTKIVDEIAALPSTSILDVGCGFGDVLIRLREEKKYQGRLVGIDAAEGMLKSAHQKNQEKNLDIDFQVADAHALPFQNEEFDLVSCNFALHSFLDITKAIAEIHRVLKPGGYFVGGIHQEGNKPQWQKIIPKLVQLLQREPTELTVARMNSTVLPSYLEGKFLIKEIKHFESPIPITDPTLFVDYMDTYQDLLFSPVPTDEEWGRVLDVVREEVERQIEEKGVFEEWTKIGIFIAQKRGEE